MKIAVMGSGAVGCYFGARLAAAGEDVAFIARGAQFEALRTRGIELKSANGDLHLPNVRVTDDPATIGPVDLVLFTVKQFDTAPAAQQAKPLVGAATAVLTLQNGMDVEDRLYAAFGREKVLDGVAYFANGAVVAPGVISHGGTLAKLIFGENDGARSPRTERFLTACEKAHIAADLTANIRAELWSKFVLLAALSGVCSVTRQALGPILAEPATRELFVEALDEVIAVAKAKGVALAPDYVGKQLALGAILPPETKASMLIDLERGNRLELEWMSGAVVRLGAAAGVPAPAHRFIYAALKHHAGGAGRR